MKNYFYEILQFLNGKDETIYYILYNFVTMNENGLYVLWNYMY